MISNLILRAKYEMRHKKWGIIRIFLLYIEFFLVRKMGNILLANVSIGDNIASIDKGGYVGGF